MDSGAVLESVILSLETARFYAWLEQVKNILSALRNFICN